MVDVDCGEDGCSTTGLENAECSPIPVPKDDPAFTKKCLMFVRSQAFMKDKCKLGKGFSLSYLQCINNTG